MRRAEAGFLLAAALIGLAVVGAAADAVVKEPVTEVLAALREDYLKDRQPDWFLKPPAGIDADDIAPLQKVTQAVNAVQAGHVRNSNAARDSYMDAQRLAWKVLSQGARDAAMVEADVLYSRRELLQPSYFTLNIERAREARRELLNGAATDKARRWEQYRLRVFGPFIDPLVGDPDARLVLAPGHPYHGLIDPNESVADEEGRDVKRWVEEESRRRGTDKLPFTERMRVLAEIHAEAARRVAARVDVHCIAPNTYACERARQRQRLHHANAALFPELAQCADKPEECGGELCGILFVCDIGRSLVASALTPALALQITGELAMGKLRLADRVARKGSDAVSDLLRSRRGSVPAAGAPGRKAEPPPRRSPSRGHPDHALKADPLAKNRVAPSQPQGTQPTGQPTAHKKPDHSTKVSDEMENQAHQVTARHGYATHQNPDVDVLEKTGYNKHHKMGKKPDSIIEGRYFDCYSPQATGPAAIATQLRSNIEGKVPKQTHRLLLNLTNNDATNAVTHEVLRKSVRDATGVGPDLVEMLLVRCPKTTPCAGRELLERLAPPW